MQRRMPEIDLDEAPERLDEIEPMDHWQARQLAQRLWGRGSLRRGNTSVIQRGAIFLVGDGPHGTISGTGATWEQAFDAALTAAGR